MKKASLIVLICCYSLATIGLSLKQFYCCGKLSSVTVVLTPGEKKTGNKAHEEPGCCNNKYQYFKVNDNHFAENISKVPCKHFIDLGSFIPSFRQEANRPVAAPSDRPPFDDLLQRGLFRVGRTPGAPPPVRAREDFLSKRMQSLC